MNEKCFKTLLRVRWYKQNKFVRKKIKRLLKISRKQQVKIFTKLGVVYKKGSKYEILPYFDLRKKYQVWGVCVGDDNRKIMLSKDDFGKEAHVIFNHNQFYVLSLNAYIRGLALPTMRDAELICASKSLIDEIMELFVLHGVKADKLVGPYVIYTDDTSYEENPASKMPVWNLNAENGEQFCEVGCFERYLTRLIKY